MKILYSCLSKSWGGMEMVALTEIKHLLELNHKVELLCLNESRIHIEANSMGIMIHPLQIIGKVHPFASAKAAARIRSGDYDIIHTHASRDLWVLVPALDLINDATPLVLTKHVGSYIIKKDFLHKKIYKRVNAIIAISNAIKKNLLETLPIDESKIKLLHNGIDMKKFDPDKGNREKIRTEFGITDEEILIGMLARFSPGKGHEDFLHAAGIINAKHPKGIKFLIVGEASRGEDAYAEKIKNMSKELSINNIIFSGFRSDTPDVLSALDIFVFPSHSESFGIALVEAMAMGIPSVCSNSEGVPDIATDNVTSLFFESGNHTDMADKIDLLIRSKELRTRFSFASVRQARERFDVLSHTESLVTLYTTLLK